MGIPPTFRGIRFTPEEAQDYLNAADVTAIPISGSGNWVIKTDWTYDDCCTGGPVDYGTINSPQLLPDGIKWNEKQLPGLSAWDKMQASFELDEACERYAKWKRQEQLRPIIELAWMVGVCSLATFLSMV